MNVKEPLTIDLVGSPTESQLMEVIVERQALRTKRVIQEVPVSVNKKEENENRKRKRYSYPLIGGYDKELPGVQRLPLSPVKDLDLAITFRKPNITSAIGSTGGTSKVPKTMPLLRDASAARDRAQKAAYDVYDPRFEDTTESSFGFERNRLIRLAKRQSERKDYFEILPDEMVLKILGFLGKPALYSCLLVGHRFNELANDEALWKRIDVMGKFLTPVASKTIFCRNPTHVRFARSLVPAPVGPGEQFTASQLLHLDLSMAEITPADLALIMSMCTSLKKCSLESLCITSEVIQGMMSFASTIDSLNLTLCYDVNFEAFSKFLPLCKRLKSLNIGCIVQTWTHSDLLLIVSTMPTGIEKLNFAGFVYRMKDDHVKILTNRLVRLKELDLSDSQEITHKSVQHIVDNLKVLESLSFSRCYNISIAAYLLLPNAPRLQNVQLFAIFKAPTIAELQENLPEIKFNTEPFSTIARPTVGLKRSSIWGERVRDL